ncbi:MAG: class I mannose-6-phosphate isomerase [Bryobacteraceae bacterium]
MSSTYDKYPYVPVTADVRACASGWQTIAQRLLVRFQSAHGVLCVECYPGVLVREIEQAIGQYFPSRAIIRTTDCFKPPNEIEGMIARDLTDDPVFGRISALQIQDFFDPELLANARSKASRSRNGMIIVLGAGATLIARNPDLLVYADLARWEIQQRQRGGRIGNLGAANESDSARAKYKRGFFLDWRVADRLKQSVWSRIDFLLDTNVPDEPKMISGDDLRKGLASAVRRPFRLVPFFDAGPWGGQWMRRVCDLPKEPPNYAWCFDCVLEENSLLLGFGDLRVEIPAIDLVFAHPHELLGEAVQARFGREFPIRFDFLDTMEGGNLSLQVHPLTEYIQEQFGMRYTQDESYYLLDAGSDATGGACVYLGLKSHIDAKAMSNDLRRAHEGGASFTVEKYVNRWPAKKHDHFLIPAGTIHCSGKNSMVLEISATPYIFTFKLWDWGRLDLDGNPRPIHLEHGLANIQWDRTDAFVRRELINQFQPRGEGDCWREERTGLHAREFIETRRHWFTGKTPHDTNGGVNVLNLVEGEAAIVESPDRAFDPLVVHYAETFIVPAAVGPYTIRPACSNTSEHATIKAFVRT